MMSLKKNDTIGFFSSSTPITGFCPTRFERAKAFLRKKGFNLKPGRLTEKTNEYRSGSIIKLNVTEKTITLLEI